METVGWALLLGALPMILFGIFEKGWMMHGIAWSMIVMGFVLLA